MSCDRVNGLKIDDFELSQVFDADGYHRDIEIKDFKEIANGRYSVTVKDLGRSDKTIKDKI